MIRIPQNGRQDRIVTGYWFDASDPAVLPADVEDFVASSGGMPVVSIGFGSMVAADPDGLRQLLVAAGRAAGARVVLIAGAGAVADQASQDEPDLITVPSIPHRALFHRMDANVHHGGAGTTANAFAAGVPTVIVPFGADQPFWARTAVDLGVAPPPVPIAQLTHERLTKSLHRALSDPHLRSRSARSQQQPSSRSSGAVDAGSSLRWRRCAHGRTQRADALRDSGPRGLAGGPSLETFPNGSIGGIGRIGRCRFIRAEGRLSLVAAKPSRLRKGAFRNGKQDSSFGVRHGAGRIRGAHRPEGPAP